MSTPNVFDNPNYHETTWIFDDSTLTAPNGVGERGQRLRASLINTDAFSVPANTKFYLGSVASRDFTQVASGLISFEDFYPPVETVPGEIQINLGDYLVNSDGSHDFDFPLGDKPTEILINLGDYAQNSDGSHDFDYPLGDKPGNTLDVPTNISAVANGSSIDITWTDAANTTSTFVFIGTASGSLTYDGFADAGIQSYSISGLSDDTYYVALTSYNSVNDTYSAQSVEQVVAVNTGSGTPPTPPSGDTFTITGTGFGTKTQAAPIKWDQFKTYADDTTLQANDPDWDEYQTNGGALIKSDTPRYAGGKYAYNDDTRSGFATNSHTFTPTDEVFFSYWYREDATYGAGGTYWIGKLGRISSSGAAGGGGVYNGLGVHALSNKNPANNSSPYLYQYNGDNTLGEVIDYVTMPNNNNWVRVDMYAKLSDLDASNGIFNCHVWGSEDYVNEAVPSLVTGNNYQLDSVILGLMHANHSGASGSLKVTDVYIDNTRQRVELTDNAVYTSSTFAEIQPATSWSDTRIDITLNTDALADGTYHLHVLNDQGVSVYTEPYVKASPTTRTVTGTGFGANGPNVVHFDSFASAVDQQLINLSQPEIGSYARYNNITAGASGSAWGWEEGGRKWLSGSNPSNLASSSGSSRLSSLIINMPQLEKEFMWAFRWRIADGYHFPTSTQDNVVESSGSAHKMNWFWNSSQGDLNGDVVIPTFVSSSTFISGNAFQPAVPSGALIYPSHGMLSGTADNFFSYYQSDNSSDGAHDGAVDIMQHAPNNNRIDVRTDIDPFNRNSGSWPKDGYDRIAVNAWIGSGNFTDCQLLYADLYLAVGPNSRARIITHDQPTLDASSNIYIVPPDTWSDTEITYTPRPHEDLPYVTVINASGTTQEGLSV